MLPNLRVGGPSNGPWHVRHSQSHPAGLREARASVALASAGVTLGPDSGRLLRRLGARSRQPWLSETPTTASYICTRRHWVQTRWKGQTGGPITRNFMTRISDRCKHSEPSPAKYVRCCARFRSCTHPGTHAGHHRVPELLTALWAAQCSCRVHFGKNCVAERLPGRWARS